MYIPKPYINTDRADLLAFMRQYSFAALITAPDRIPVATHLPFAIEERGESVLLLSHVAKANPQWQDIESHPALVVFNEPHAYISPAHYDGVQNVPTWNYAAVHAYGSVHLISTPEESAALLEKMMLTYEPAYKAQWDGLPETYKEKMLAGIVAFEIEVSDLQGKKKLSQNKSAAEQARIIAAFEHSPLSHEQEIARLMKKDR